MEMKQLLKQGIADALAKAVQAGTLPQGDYPDIILEVPPQKEFGDFASNIAMADQVDVSDKGGTMRLGLYPCKLDESSKSFGVYGKDLIYERHRHRWEFNNKYRTELVNAGLKIVGQSPDDRLVEMIEVPDHPWFVGCQFHPELKSRPTNAHPLFRGLVKAALDIKNK